MSVELFTQGMPALISGSAAAVCLMAAPMFRSRQSILAAQLAAGICFATHYAFLGVAVASAANILGTVQTLTAMRATQSASMNRLGYLLIGLMALMCLWLWQGPISLLSLAAMMLIALGRMQTSDLWLRCLLLAGGGFWIVHDLMIQAWIAFAADIGAFLFGVVALLALHVKVRIEWPRPSQPASIA